MVRLVCQIAAGLLLVTGNADWWHLAGIGLVYGSADAFFQPAIYGLLPELVPPAQLQEANALRGLTDSSALILGPAAAGPLSEAIGLQEALIGMSAIGVLVAACVLAVPSVRTVARP